MIRLIVWLATMAIVWGIPCSIDIGLAHTPDVVTASANAGTFLASSGAPGGFSSPPSTSVQTSTGSIIVNGNFSGEIGQRLVLERRLKSGMQLCVEEGAVCAPLAGVWPGKLQPQPHIRPPLAFLAPFQREGWLGDIYFFAFLFTLLLTLIVVAVGRLPRVDDNEAAKQGDEA